MPTQNKFLNKKTVLLLVALFGALIFSAVFFIAHKPLPFRIAEVVALPVNVGSFFNGFITPASCGAGFGHPTWGGACSFTCPDGTVLDSPQQSCPVPPLPTCTVSITPSTLPRPGNVTFNWTSSNDADGQIPFTCRGVSGEVVSEVFTTPSGSRLKTGVTETQTCTLTVQNTSGTGRCSASVTVGAAVCGNGICEASETSATCPADCGVGGGGVITSFTAAPGSITEGQSTTLSWVSNQSSCSIDQGIGTVSGSGSRVVSPTVTTTYTLTCGPKTAQVTVLVSSKPKFKEVVPE